MKHLSNIAYGYFGLIKKLATGLAVGAGILAACAILVFPIWAIAEHYPEVFNTGFLVVLALLGGYLLYRRIRSVQRNTETRVSSLWRRLLVKLLKILLFLIFLGGQLLFYGSGQFILGGVTSLLFLLVFGYILFSGNER